MAVEFHEFDRDGDMLLVLGGHSRTEDDLEISSPTHSITSTKFDERGTPDGSPVFKNSMSAESTLIPDSKAKPAAEIHMLVSSKSLMLASPVFKAMLRDNTFREGRELSLTGKVSVALPDENPEALRIVLNIIHLRTRQVPKKITWAMLVHLSILVDKYQMLECVETYVDLWIADEDVKKALPSSWEPKVFPWLSISWVYNLPVEFKHLTQLVMQQSIEEISVPMFEGYELPIPEVLVDTIQESRQNAICLAIACVHEKIASYLGPDVHCSNRFYRMQAADNKRACDDLTLGSLIRCSAAIGIWPAPSPPYTAMSWQSTRDQILNMNFTSACYQFSSELKYDCNADSTHGAKASLDSRLYDVNDQIMSGIELASLK